jgi:hypothetical protein
MFGRHLDVDLALFSGCFDQSTDILQMPLEVLIIPMLTLFRRPKVFVYFCFRCHQHMIDAGLSAWKREYFIVICTESNWTDRTNS